MIRTGEPVLDGNEQKYVLDCLKRNWISFGGKYTKKFEAQFAKYLGVKYALACSSGTAALHLALTSLGIDAGDEVIIPDFTIIASASTVIWTGAKPVLVDVDQYFCIDPNKIEEKITPKTQAIMVVHMYGNPANMEAILKIAKRYQLYVIEDACGAHGAEVLGQKVGSIGDVGCFSFYSTKTITTGEGGMVVTNNQKIAEKIAILRDYGHAQPRFTHKVLGFNYRLTDLQAAIGLAQLEKIAQKVNKKRKIASNYNKLLDGTAELTLVKDPPWGRSAFWMYPLLVNDTFGRSRDQIIKILLKQGIEATPFFTPISQQPVFKGIYNICPKSQELSKRGLYIPSGINLSLDQQKYVVNTLLSIVKK